MILYDIIQITMRDGKEARRGARSLALKLSRTRSTSADMLS